MLQLQERENRKFACTCTTGIACTLYGEFGAQTIHSFAGIGQCRGSKEGLLKNVLSNEECVNRWRETEVLFVDEVSMLSQRTFEIVNYIAQNIRNSDYALGGIQAVAFGDVLQLPPVPSSVDRGKYAFQSALWNIIFPHQIVLEHNFRAKDDQTLADLVNDISKEHYTQQNIELMKILSRPLCIEDLGVSYIPKVYPLNDDVSYANICALDNMPGKEIIFYVYDIGDKKLLKQRINC
jgi:hypothetical protein